MVLSLPRLVELISTGIRQHDNDNTSSVGVRAYPRKSGKSLSVCLSVCPVTSLADLTITELPDIRISVDFKIGLM